MGVSGGFFSGNLVQFLKHGSGFTILVPGFDGSGGLLGRLLPQRHRWLELLRAQHHGLEATRLGGGSQLQAACVYN